MDDSPFVPQRGPVDPSPHTCMYGQTPGPGCGAPGTWHIDWGNDCASISCNTHMEVVQARWVYARRHPLAPDCGMPNVIWTPDGCTAGPEPHGVVLAVSVRGYVPA